MVDIVDRAQAHEEKLREQALNALTPVHETESVDTDTPRFCEDCDETIPLARVKAVPHCTRCIECQERVERCRRL